MVTWNGIKIADRGFLINLEERKDRLEESLKEFDKNNIVGVERFDAIKITEDSDEFGWIIRGCTHSHMEILKTQVENNFEKVITKAVEEAKALHKTGFGAVMIENMHDAPYLKEKVGPEIVAAMTVVGAEIKKAVALPLGIQILAGANESALSARLRRNDSNTRSPTTSDLVFGVACPSASVAVCAASAHSPLVASRPSFDRYAKFHRAHALLG
jgi:hypothetical protein